MCSLAVSALVAFSAPPVYYEITNRPHVIYETWTEFGDVLFVVVRIFASDHDGVTAQASQGVFYSAPTLADTLDRLNDDHHTKSHALDSAPVYVLVLFRLVLLGVFLLGAIKTFEAEQSAVRRSFIGRLVVLGTLWFAAIPVLVLVAMICAEYIREPVSSGRALGAKQ